MKQEPLGILVIEDSEDDRKIYDRFLNSDKYHLHEAEIGKKGVDLYRLQKIDCVLLDNFLPDNSGLDILKELKKINEHVPIIMLTGKGNETLAVDAMKIGAQDYLVKGEINPDKLQYAIAKAIENATLQKQLQQRTKELIDSNFQLKKSLEDAKNKLNEQKTGKFHTREKIKLSFKHEKIIGQSIAIQQVLMQVEQVAQTNSNIIILGETGTGKELIAQTIHDLSLRKKQPMIKVNCAALPAALIENELFGREKGAYTGALTKSVGRFEAAHDSTLFLDEIGDLAIDLQAKLLRILEDGRFERLGSSSSIQVNVRVIAATNQDLKEAIKKGTFREDLYYRLHVFPIHLPPLRERKEDIPLLVWKFVEDFSKSMGKKIDHIPDKTMQQIQKYSWPGNVRQLRNVIEHAVIITKSKTLNVNIPNNSDSTEPGGTLEDVERNHILSTLEKTNWRIKGKNGCSEILGIPPSTLYSKMKKLGIKRPQN